MPYSSGLNKRCSGPAHRRLQAEPIHRAAPGRSSRPVMQQVGLEDRIGNENGRSPRLPVSQAGGAQGPEIAGLFRPDQYGSHRLRPFGPVPGPLRVNPVGVACETEPDPGLVRKIPVTKPHGRGETFPLGSFLRMTATMPRPSVRIPKHESFRTERLNPLPGCRQPEDARRRQLTGPPWPAGRRGSF